MLWPHCYHQASKNFRENKDKEHATAVIAAAALTATKTSKNLLETNTCSLKIEKRIYKREGTLRESWLKLGFY